MSLPGQPRSFQMVVYFPYTSLDYSTLHRELEDLGALWTENVSSDFFDPEIQIKYVPAQEHTCTGYTLPATEHLRLVVSLHGEDLDFVYSDCNWHHISALYSKAGWEVLTQ